MAAADSRFGLLAELIAGSEHNLVSRRDRATVAAVHIPESLAVGQLLPLHPGGRWVDLGTGGGLPGLVLALGWPDVEWALIDATQKKIEAVAAFARTLKLDNVRTVWGRAEVLARQGRFREQFDGVVCRALARVVVAAELARGFLKPDGTFATVKGGRAAEEIAEAMPVLGLLGFTDVNRFAVLDTVRPTNLVMMRAAGAVPPAVPRREGVPQAQPLGRG